MIEPKRAPVRPRVRLQPSGEVVLLEEVVADHLAAGRPQTILLCGEVGAGTTAALQHLAECFATNPGVRFDGSSYETDLPTEDPRGWIIIHSEKPQFGHLIRTQLAGWGRDEWIEYLLAVHHDRCASVMQRLHGDVDCERLFGNANVWRQVLDELAADDGLVGVKAALLRILSREFSDPTVRHMLASRCYSLMISKAARSEDQEAWASLTMTVEQDRLLQSPFIQLLLAGEAAAWDLAHSDLSQTLRHRWPGRLVDSVRSHVACSPLIQGKLRAMLVPKHLVAHPLAASLLHVSGIGWKPEPPRLLGLKTGRLNLAGAFLPEAEWPGIDLSRCSLVMAIFTRAKLQGIKLDGAFARQADFSDANLKYAVVSRLRGMSANFCGANLAAARGDDVELEKANLSGANLTEAKLTNSELREANLRNVVFRRATLTATNFANAMIDGADFTDADLELANLPGLDLTVACFDQATFVRACLRGCNLEGMVLPRPNFSGAELANALLTGSVMSHANFTGANLQEAGLAEIDWEFADLRKANLRGVSFHLGSTRDGLVGSTIPMHGSRTGFYTDDYNEQDFKAPEEIRKANLRGADLRGADITDVDFYLVDLRDALYDHAQREHLRRCGAILETRTRDD